MSRVAQAAGMVPAQSQSAPDSVGAGAVTVRARVARCCAATPAGEIIERTSASPVNSAREIFEAIKRTVADFSGHAPLEDDQTGLIVRRTP